MFCPRVGGLLVDVTLGLGGHAASLLELCPDCTLLGIDRDPRALALAQERLAGLQNPMKLVCTPFDELPRILIIDELDKISDSRDLSALLTWMESGRIIITKHGLRDERRGKGWVFAACNRLKGLPPELLDRFQIFHIKPYEPDQYKRVVTNYLVKREGVKRELAKYIAERTAEYTNSVREAIRISRIAKTKSKVDKVIATIQKFREAD